MHHAHLALTTYLMHIGVVVSRVFSFTSTQEFFYSCISPSSALLQTFLSKEPSETLDASMTFNFSVSVCNSIIFRSLECLCCRRRPTSFYEDFWVFYLRSLGFVLSGL